MQRGGKRILPKETCLIWKVWSHRIASDDVILQLIKSKCIPSLLYGFDACALTKSELSSLDFIVNRFFYEAI